MLRRRKRAGFTLVEMIVATAVLVIGVVSALECIAMTTRASGRASDYATASLIAQQRFAEIDAAPDQLSSGGDQQTDVGDQYPGYTISQTVEATDITAISKITLMVQWPGSGINRQSAQFVSYVNTTTPTTDTSSSSSSSTTQ